MSSVDQESVSRLPETIAYTLENGERAIYRRDVDTDQHSVFMNPGASNSHCSFFSATSSNATMPNISGPGRLLGNFLEVAGGKVEKNIGLFAYKTGLHPAARAEQRLKHWSPSSTEAGVVFLLRCLAASDRPPLQRAAFRVYINFVISCLTRYWLNDHQAIEGYRRLRVSLQRAIRKTPSLALSSWRARDAEYDEDWLLYYEAAGFLWSLEDAESWIAAQTHYLRIGNAERKSGHTNHERLLVYFVGSWICDMSGASFGSWHHNLFAIVQSQLRFGPECREKEGVDLLAAALISRTLEDVSVRPWLIYDDDDIIEPLFEVIEEVRRWEGSFPNAYAELQKRASEICNLFIVFDCHRSVTKGSKLPISSPHQRFLACEGQFNNNFVKQGSRWSIRSWKSTENLRVPEVKNSTRKRSGTV